MSAAFTFGQGQQNHVSFSFRAKAAKPRLLLSLWARAAKSRLLLLLPDQSRTITPAFTFGQRITSAAFHFGQKQQNHVYYIHFSRNRFERAARTVYFTCPHAGRAMLIHRVSAEISFSFCVCLSEALHDNMLFLENERS